MAILNDILATMPEEQESISLLEKCSGYLTCEVLHDSRQRKIYQTNLEKFESEIIEIPEYIRNIQALKRKDLLVRERSTPRFRQQCKKQTRCQTTAVKTTPIRQIILDEIVQCLPDQNINWSYVPEPATRILNLYVSDQVSFEILEIYKAWLKKYHELHSPQFTPLEDQRILEMVSICGDNQWAYIAKLINTKTSIQLRERWFKVLNQDIKRKRWTPLEDLKLVVLVDHFGVGSWNKLHQYFKNRTEVQIRERWCNVLDPDLEVREWTQLEIEQLTQLQGIHGNAWSVISLQLNRTDNECRRKFQSLQKT